MIVTLGDTLLPSTSRDNVTDSRISYDELRRLNRADHEKKKYESSSSRPSPPSQRDSVIQPQDSPKPRKLKKSPFLSPFNTNRLLISLLSLNTCPACASWCHVTLVRTSVCDRRTFPDLSHDVQLMGDLLGVKRTLYVSQHGQLSHLSP